METLKHKLCSVPGCGGAYYGGGLCKPCYHKAYDNAYNNEERKPLSALELKSAAGVLRSVGLTKDKVLAFTRKNGMIKEAV